MTENDARAAVVSEARTWLSTPWVHHARVKGAGVDCAHFIAAVYEAAGVTPRVEIENYPRDWAEHRDDERFRRAVEKWAVKVERAPRPGDVVLFRYGKCLSHGGIVVEWPKIIHAYAKQPRRVTLDDAERNEELRSRFGGCWSFWGT